MDLDLLAAYDTLKGPASLEEKKIIISTTTDALFSLMDDNISHLQDSLGAQQYTFLKKNIHLCLDSIYRYLQYLGFMEKNTLTAIKAGIVLYFSDTDFLVSLREKLVLLHTYLNDLELYTIGLKHHVDIVDTTSSDVKLWMQKLSEFENLSNHNDAFTAVLRKKTLLETLLDTSYIAYRQYENALLFYNNLSQLHSELIYVTQNFHNLSLLQEKKQSIQDIFNKI